VRRADHYQSDKIRAIFCGYGVVPLVSVGPPARIQEWPNLSHLRVSGFPYYVGTGASGSSVELRSDRASGGLGRLAGGLRVPGA
jgi:hypothetical protein